ncbi:MAG: adenylate/guanylate cyclase domain-containing protein [Aeromicrobium sp.]
MHGEVGIVCRQCGHENPDGSRFCGLCGETLAAETTCSGCGEIVPPGSKFCNHCGTPVGAPVQPVLAIPEDLAWKIDAGRESLEGERKQITVLFADVRGSMDLAERLDPESWRELMSRFFQVLADAVHRADGTVDKFTGDGIMALFGAPIAREDHAQCACRAALEMIDGVAALATEVSAEGIDLAVRIGINSGEVVVGSIGDEGEMEYTAIGHTVGLAQRMETAAETGTAYLTARTAALAEGFFELSDLGEREIKGASEPIKVFRLEGAGTAHGHLDVSRSRGLSGFVGRSDEVAELQAAFARSLGGSGEVIGVVAPAGVGKSRLCQEFADQCRERGIRVYEAQCEAHTREIPLVPVLHLLRSRFGIAAGDTVTEARSKILSELLALGSDFGTAEELELVYDFLGVRDADAPEIPMKGDARNRRLRDLVRRLVQVTNREPSVVLVEDLQWIDAASALFLETLVEAIPASGGLVVATFRPEYRASWMSGSHYRQVPLTTLPQDALEDLLGELLGPDRSLDGLGELIAERTGGNPLYVEEIVRELDESGTLAGERGDYRMAREIDELPVPPTVQAILAARIDRLPPHAKVTLQTAAAIGSESSRGLLSQVVDLDDDALDGAIRALIETEFLHVTALYPEQILAFRHPLTQEVAYGSQLAQARARAHNAVAMGLQATDPERVDENAGLIAQHFERAGDAMQAAQWHLRAIGWAGLRDPMASIRHALQIVDLDAGLPGDPDGDAMRLTARLYVATMGWRVGADTTTIRRAYDEGVVIATRIGNDTFLTLLHAAFAACPVTCEGRLAEGLEIAMEAVRLADAGGDPGLRALTKTFPAYCLWQQGRAAEMIAMCEEILDLTVDDPQIPFAELVASPRAWAFIARSVGLVSLGRSEEAHESIEHGLALAETDEETLGWAHMFAAMFHILDEAIELDELFEHVRIAWEIAERLGDAFSRTWARFWIAYATLQRGETEAAIDAFTRGLTAIRESGSGRESESWFRNGLAMATVASGRIDEGIDTARQALTVAESQGVAAGMVLSRVLLAEWLLDRGGATDVDEATEHLRLAHDFAAEHAHVPHLTRIAALRDRLPATA